MHCQISIYIYVYSIENQCFMWNLSSLFLSERIIYDRNNLLITKNFKFFGIFEIVIGRRESHFLFRWVLHFLAGIIFQRDFLCQVVIVVVWKVCIEANTNELSIPSHKMFRKGGFILLQCIPIFQPLKAY